VVGRKRFVPADAGRLQSGGLTNGGLSALQTASLKKPRNFSGRMPAREKGRTIKQNAGVGEEQKHSNEEKKMKNF